MTVTGAIGKGSGTFVIDHPLDPENKLLYHSFVESPDVKNIYDGIATLDKNGEARVRLPNYFMTLNDEFRYQLDPIGKPQPNLHVKDQIENGTFTIGGGEPGGRVSWQVSAIRKDPYIVANPMIIDVQKSSSTPVVSGKYLHEDVYAEVPTAQVRGWLEDGRTFLSRLFD